MRASLRGRRIYFAFIAAGTNSHRSFSSVGLSPVHSHWREPMLDLIYLALGLGMFGLLGLYAMAADRL